MTPKEVAQAIYNYFVPLIGDIGVAGLLGNLYCESGLVVNRLQGDFTPGYTKSADYVRKVNSGIISREQFGKDGKGFSLWQLTFYTRKWGLYDRTVAIGKSIDDFPTLLEYLKYELTNYGLIPKLKASKTILEASNIILLQFEKPLHQGPEVQKQRASYGQYWYNEVIKPSSSTPVVASNAPNIIKVTSTANTTSKPNRAINWIVIHYTAGTTSRSGTAKNVANYFSKSSTQASADFIVDDTDIVQFNPDIYNRYCWSVGGGRYSTNSTSLASKYYQKCMNNNSVSIEICSSKKSTRTLKATDTDWYFTDAVLNNAVILTKYLMQLLNIDIDHVITHHHVMGKLCPAMWTQNEAALQGWYNFKSRLGQSNVPQPAIPGVSSGDYSYTINNIDYSPIFDPDYYYNRYPDLQKAIGKDNKKLFEHFIHFGLKEGRWGKANFNVLAYRNNNPDLQKAYGMTPDSLPHYATHYLVYGKNEHRKAV